MKLFTVHCRIAYMLRHFGLTAISTRRVEWKPILRKIIHHSNTLTREVRWIFKLFKPFSHKNFLNENKKNIVGSKRCINLNNEDKWNGSNKFSVYVQRFRLKVRLITINVFESIWFIYIWMEGRSRWYSGCLYLCVWLEKSKTVLVCIHFDWIICQSNWTHGNSINVVTRIGIRLCHSILYHFIGFVSKWIDRI